MIAALSSLSHWSSSKLTGPNHQSRLQQSSLLQIIKQRGDWLIGLSRVASVILIALIMAVPAELINGVIKLDEANSLFDQSTRQQAHSPIKSFVFRLIMQTIRLLSFLRLLRQFTNVNRFRLHAIRQLIRRNATIQIQHPRSLRRVATIHRLCEINRAAL